MSIEPENDKYEAEAKVFKAFCDEKRLRILELLRGGEKCACVLIERLNVGQSGLAYHMKVLCDSGIVDSRQEGKWTHYRISEAGSVYAGELLRRLTAPDAVTGNTTAGGESGASKVYGDVAADIAGEDKAAGDEFCGNKATGVTAGKTKPCCDA